MYQNYIYNVRFILLFKCIIIYNEPFYFSANESNRIKYIYNLSKIDTRKNERIVLYIVGEIS